MRAALAVVALLVAAAVGLGTVVVSDARADARRSAALTAGEAAALRVLSYDHRRIDDDVAAARAVATGDFLEQYDAATDGLVEQAREAEAVVTADVRAASVAATEDSDVVLLLFVDQRTVRDDVEEPRLDQNRVRLTMREVDGRWRVAALEVL